jgi:hypothetical protein
MAIDDPIDAAKKWNPEKKNSALDILFDVADKFHPLAGLVNIVQKFFSGEAAKQRVRALLEALESEIRRLDETFESIGNLKSPEGFAQAAIEAVDASLRTSNLAKIKRFAAILGFSVTHQEGNANWDEVASYIRDIAQLSDQDIEALKILYSVYAPLFSGETIDLNPNQFVDRMKYVTQAIQEARIQPDEFYSRCSRLNGFGLAIEVQKTPNVGFGQYCYRPTARGKRLITMIQHLDNKGQQ